MVEASKIKRLDHRWFVPISYRLYMLLISSLSKINWTLLFVFFLVIWYRWGLFGVRLSPHQGLIATKTLSCPVYMFTLSLSSLNHNERIGQIRNISWQMCSLQKCERLGTKSEGHGAVITVVVAEGLPKPTPASCDGRAEPAAWRVVTENHLFITGGGQWEARRADQWRGRSGARSRASRPAAASATVRTAVIVMW